MCDFNSCDIRKEKFKSNFYALLIEYESPDFFLISIDILQKIRKKT